MNVKRLLTVIADMREHSSRLGFGRSLCEKWADLLADFADTLQETTCPNCELVTPRTITEGDRIREQNEAFDIAEQMQGRPVEVVALAVIGRKHFGNPIPSAWYSAAKELLANPAPAPESRSVFHMRCGHTTNAPAPEVDAERIRVLEGVGAEYNAWVLFHSAGNGDYDDFVRHHVTGGGK